MNKGRIIALLLLLSCSIPGAVWSQTGKPGEALETTGSGIINWTSGEISATGVGAPPSQPVNAAQARAMAERAAFVVALRNLLETVKGVRVDSESVVENMMVKSDVIRTRVDGIVNGARVVKTAYMSDGSVEVQVAMPIRGALLDAIVPESFGRFQGTPQTLKPLPSSPYPAKPSVPQQLPQKPAEPSKPEPTKPVPVVPPPSSPERKPEPVKPSLPPSAVSPEKKPEPSKPISPAGPGESTAEFKGGVATGLVIDGRGLGLRPALLPKIIDPQGQEIYVGQVVTRTNAVEQGVAGYAKDVNAAANNFRVTDNPAIIKGLRASGTAKTDVVVGQPDAQTLRQLSGRGDFLQYCRVIIVY